MTQELQDYLDHAKTIIEQAVGDKYTGAGVYQIFIDEKLVYIGQSKSMIDRIASHMYHIDNPERTNKYIQLRRARDAGHKITFDVMQRCSEDELKKVEGELIRKYMPPLNHQIPKAYGNGYEVQKTAKTITYERILAITE